MANKHSLPGKDTKVKSRTMEKKNYIVRVVFLCFIIILFTVYNLLKDAFIVDIYVE